MLRVLDLFSGIGGFSLGLERTGGFKTVAFCEIEDYPRRVLAKHWPEVPIYHDVRELTADTLRRDGIAVDVICGGFPCQDISVAGNGAGIDGERSGLWREYARLIGELRPEYVLVENVAALLGRGLERVLGDLATIGYDAEWHCIPASAVGAPHRRDRIWIVANPVRDSIRDKQRWRNGARGTVSRVPRNHGEEGHVADAYARGCAVRRKPEAFSNRLLDGNDVRGCAPWKPESGVRRVADGVPNRAHRISALGNAVVPQIPELIGRAILSSLQHPIAEAAE